MAIAPLPPDPIAVDPISVDPLPVDPVDVVAAPVNTEVFAEAAYVAVETQETDPKTGQPLHVEIVGDPVAVPVGHDSVLVVFHRADFGKDTEKLAVKGRVELSLDGGFTWSPKPSGEKDWPYGVFPIGFTACGGDVLRKDGTVETMVSPGTRPLPDIKNPNRLVRVTLIPLVDITVKAELVTGAAGVKV